MIIVILISVAMGWFQPLVGLGTRSIGEIPVYKAARNGCHCCRNKHKAVLYANPLGKACYELNQERVTLA